MFSLLADENFNNNIIRGLLIRKPNVNLIRVQDVGLSGEDDPVVLEWAARNDYILITHDVESIPCFAYERIKSGLMMPGVFIANQEVPIGQLINDLLILIECSEQKEWMNQVFFFSL